MSTDRAATEEQAAESTEDEELTLTGQMVFKGDFEEDEE